jgi:hypothetical protein
MSDTGRRALTAQEMTTILDKIAASTNGGELVNQTVRAVFNALLPEGQSFDDYSPEQRLDPSAYKIPQNQWTAITTAATDRAQEWGVATEVALALAVDLMPGTYEDPDAYVPTVKRRVDHRLPVHTLTVTREAVDVIAACASHVQELGNAYGRESRWYLEAAVSWQRVLARLFDMGFGAESRVMKDGDLSLFVSTGGGFVYGVIFHGVERRCTFEGCRAVLTDDGTLRINDGAPSTHLHEWLYPQEAPTPGAWSTHS